MNFKDRIVRSKSVWSQFLPKQKLFNQQIVTGAVAGDVAVSGVLFGDELISVFNLTALTDVTSEFTIRADGIINNDGETTTATEAVMVTYIQWKKR